MELEHSLAARYIRQDILAGFGPQAAIARATKLLVAQGFSQKRSKKVAEQMARLVA
jgi:molybdopterin/thiamine biosynthesis adenylyltransferase